MPKKHRTQKIKFIDLEDGNGKIPYFTIYGNAYYLNDHCPGKIGLLTLTPEIAYTLKRVGDDKLLIEDVYENQPSSKVGKKVNSLKSKQGKLTQGQREMCSRQPDLDSLKEYCKEQKISFQAGKYWWDKDRREGSKEIYRVETYPRRKKNTKFQKRTVRRMFRNGNRVLSGELEIGRDYKPLLIDPEYSKGIKNGQE